MGLLDSNKSYLKKEHVLLVSDLTTSSAIKRFVIDTKQYNNLVITVKSAGGNSIFSVKKQKTGSASPSAEVPVFCVEQNKLYRGELIMGSSNQNNFIIDCSYNEEIVIERTDGTGTNVVWYTLTQNSSVSEFLPFITSKIEDALNKEDVFGIIGTNIESDASVKTWNINCVNYRKLCLIIASTPASTFSMYKGYASDDVNRMGYQKYPGFPLIDNTTNNIIESNVSVNCPQASAQVFTIDVSDCQGFRLQKTDSVARHNFIYYTLSKEAVVWPTKQVSVSNSQLNVKVNDSTPVNVKVVDSKYTAMIKSLSDLDDYEILMHDSVADGKTLSAVYKNVAVYNTRTSLFISTTGLSGATTEVTLNSTNFPNLISNSQINRIVIVPWTRRYHSYSPHRYNGTDWRIVVFTTKCQIYHNFPSRAADYDGDVVSGDEYRFDESVVWDLPDRINYVKTQSGDDATLIATGKYKYMPCLPDHMYEMHPAINANTGYGNNGFGALRTYTDIDGSTKTRARFFVPVRGFADGNSFNWLSGYISDNRITVIGTYAGGYNYMCRMCVFTTNDGREWFVTKEYAPNSHYAYYNGNNIWQRPGMSAYAEYDDPENNRIRFGTNTMTNASLYAVKTRTLLVPDADNKEPYKTHDGHEAAKFIYGEAIGIQEITSSQSDGIVVTLSRNITDNDNLDGSADIIIEKVGSSSDTSWDWLCSVDHTAMSSGNGTIWKVQRLDGQANKFRLMLEIKNPNEILPCRHIHSLNFTRDGFIISCGEAHPQGWIEYVSIKGNDAASNIFSGNSYPIYRLTSTPTAVQRTLGCEMIEEGHENYIYFAADSSTIPPRSNVTLPSDRTDEFNRNSLGIYKGKLSDIDNFNEFDCILDVGEPAYFFKRVGGLMIYTSQFRTIAISKDNGENWTIIPIPISTFGNSWLLGVSNKKEICLKCYAFTYSGDSIIIRSKV